MIYLWQGTRELAAGEYYTAVCAARMRIKKVVAGAGWENLRVSNF